MKASGGSEKKRLLVAVTGRVCGRAACCGCAIRVVVNEWLLRERRSDEEERGGESRWCSSLHDDAGASGESAGGGGM